MADDQCHSIAIHTIIAATCLPKEALGLVTSHGSCGPCGHCAWSQDGGSGSSCSAGGTARAAEPEALQPAAPPEEEQAQHVEDFLAQELEEADVQSLAQRSQRSHYDDLLVEAAFDHNQRAQREIVESVSTLLSQQPAMSAELLMLRQEDIQKFSVTMTQAPAGFRRRYDTGADFSWALAGFNFVVGSFYRGGIRTHESQSEICACASSQIFASKAL